TMTLDNQSTVVLASGSQLNAWGANRTIEIIVIGGVHKFDQKNAARINGFGIANKLSGVAPLGFSTNASLPVTFSSFYATRSNSDVLLSWSTAQELNNNNFEIQRSTDGINWSVITLVMGQGNSITPTQYSYTDKNVTAATVYYRIRQVDIDGKFEYTDVKTVRSNETAAVAKIYAANNMINIEFNAATEGTVIVRLINAGGQLIAEQHFQQAQYRVTMNTYGKGAGLYVVQVSDSKGWSQSSKIIL
ncbi:MAG TPA: T9SS type A sorting domain-containing protein, partial [Chitinophagaceae bacterium]